LWVKPWSSSRQMMSAWKPKPRVFGCQRICSARATLIGAGVSGVGDAPIGGYGTWGHGTLSLLTETL
jgi:hypothetical protein